MNRTVVGMALLAVSGFLLTGCTGRTLLHGSRSVHHLRPADSLGLAERSPSRLVSVWFVKSDPSGLGVVRVGRKPTGADQLQQAVEELLDGPSAAESSQGLGTEIPRGTILLGVTRKGGDVELNLSRRFASDGGISSFQTRLDQLRKTVGASAGSANVYLNVEGKRLNMEEGEGIEIHQPLNR